MSAVHGLECDCGQAELKKLRVDIKNEEILRNGKPCHPCAMKEYIIEDLERLTTHEVGKVYKFVRRLIADI